VSDAADVEDDAVRKYGNLIETSAGVKPANRNLERSCPTDS
jgi:hypothetical protein